MRSSWEAPKFVFDRESQSEFPVTLSRAELLNANWRNELLSSRRNKPQVKWFPFLFRVSVWSKPHISSMKTETQNRLQKKADIAFLSTSDIFFNLKSAKVFTRVSVTTASLRFQNLSFIKSWNWVCECSWKTVGSGQAGEAGASPSLSHSFPGSRAPWRLRGEEPSPRQETQAWPLGQEDPRRRKWQPAPSIADWETPQTEEAGGIVQGGRKRVRNDSATKQQELTSGNDCILNKENVSNTLILQQWNLNWISYVWK